MILNCPNCSTRYLLSSAAIGERGRELRCAKCAHEWFQEPEMEHSAAYESVEPSLDDLNDLPDLGFTAREDVMGDEDGYATTDDAEMPSEEGFDEPESFEAPAIDDADKIPEAVKPLPRLKEGEDKKHQKPEKIKRPPASLQARMAGYGAALMIFICIIFAGLVFKQKIATVWPPAAIIYDMAGMPVMFKGENLVMESLSATVIKNEKGQDILVLKGRVINLTDGPIDVPNLMAILRSTNGEDGDKWVIEPPVDVVEPGASFAFTSDYPNVPRGVGSVNLIFVPMVIGALPATSLENQG